MKPVTVFFLAKRFLISRQKKTAVSVISWIAVLGMLVSSAAMVILLSAFNGIEGMIEGMYTAFDQEVTMTPKNGSKISADSLRKVLSLTKNIEGVNAQSMFIQERIIIRKEKKWANAELWAVEPSFFEMANVNTPEHLINGNPLTGSGQALMGVGLAISLDYILWICPPKQPSFTSRDKTAKFVLESLHFFNSAFRCPVL